MSNPFDYVKAISQTKEDMMTGTNNDAMAEKDYNPFIVNRALSQYPDTVLIANEMNLRSMLDKKLQFDFFLNMVRPRKRFAKWAKKENDSNVELVKQYFGYSEQKARDALSILTDEHLDTIRKKMDTGGSHGRTNDRGDSKGAR